MTVLFFGISGFVSILIVCLSFGIYYHLPDHWLCEYGETPSVRHQPQNRCPRPAAAAGCLWIGMFTVLYVYGSAGGSRSGGILLFSLKEFRDPEELLVFLRPEFLYLLLLSLFLLPAVLSDLDYCIIPDQCSLLTIMAAFLKGIAENGLSGIKAPVYGGLLCGGLVLLSAAISSFLAQTDAMGMGDIKLFIACGAAAASSAGMDGAAPAAVAVFTGAVLMSAVWFSLLLLLRKAKYGEARPMAPWIAFSALLMTASF